ncbi:MAG: hypothetical protein M0Z53_11050 [Thermaerobacter sp.]|nr:hypothetical protein [Thermaerobacter sp.]
MMTNALRRSLEVVWREKQTWWIVLWVMLLWIGLLGAGAVIAGALLGISNLGSVIGGSVTAASLGSMMSGLRASAAGLAVFVMLVIFGGVPFTIAGVYGTLADAVRETPVSTASFWRNGMTYLGRAYGVLGWAGALWIGLGVVLVIFFLIAKAIGLIGVILLTLAGVVGVLFVGLWLNWTISALFVGKLSWVKSIGSGQRDARRYWGATLLTMLVLVGIDIVIELLGLLLTHLLGLLGTLVLFVFEGWFGLFSVAAYLSLYQEAHDGKGPPGSPAAVVTNLSPPTW